MKQILLAILFITNLHAAGHFTGFTDTEMENFIKDMAEIIYKQSNLDHHDIKVFFIANNDINAFVDISNHIYAFSGLILKLEHALEVFSILCHEVGHVACGHIAMLQARMEHLSNIGIAMLPILVLVGIANPGAAIGTLLASGSILTHQLCLYTIGEEKAADDFALQTLIKLGYPLDGFITTFRKLLLAEKMYDIKNISFRTHPLTETRIKNAQAILDAAIKKKYQRNTFPEKFQEQFERIFYKLSGFLRSRKDFYNNTLKSKKYITYGEAVLLHKEGKTPDAIKLINKLLEDSPNDPYYLELKGQILAESGNYLESITAYTKALEVLPSAYLIRVDLAKSVIKIANEKISSSQLASLFLQLEIKAKPKKKYKKILLDKALELLKIAELSDYDNLDTITAMLACYRERGDMAMSLFMLGRISYLQGNLNRAVQELDQSITLLKKQKREYILVEDFLLFVINQEQSKH